MLSKILISYALFVTAQAGYASARPGYGAVSLNAGYAALLQPRVTLQVLPAGPGYGVVSSAYSVPPVYGVDPAYGAAAYNRGAAGDDGSTLGLTKLALTLPSAGHPNPAVINVPQHPITSYSAPAVAVASGDYGINSGLVSSQSAAVAVSNVK